MTTYKINNWTVQWSTPSNANFSKSVALFSCVSMKSNIIYSYEDMMIALADEDFSAVPKDIFEMALHMLYTQDDLQIAA